MNTANLLIQHQHLVNDFQKLWDSACDLEIANFNDIVLKANGNGEFFIWKVKTRRHLFPTQTESYKVIINPYNHDLLNLIETLKNGFFDGSLDGLAEFLYENNYRVNKDATSTLSDLNAVIRTMNMVYGNTENLALLLNELEIKRIDI